MQDYFVKIEALVDKVEDWARLSANPLVSVWLIAYNHEPFIHESLNSILMQNVDFEYEIIIGEDKSTDRTKEIVLDYQRRHPDKIRLRLARENLYSQGLKPGIGGRAACRGKYIAPLEGDDYWTDPLKLQKQVDFLEAHPECNLCFHPAIECFADGRTVNDRVICRHSDHECVFGIDTVIFGSGKFMPTASLLIRAGVVNDLPEWFTQAPVGDTFLQIYASRAGGALFIPDIMAVYRRYAPGSWGESLQCVEAQRRLYQGYKECFELMKKDFPQHQDLLHYRIAYYRALLKQIDDTPHSSSEGTNKKHRNQVTQNKLDNVTLPEEKEINKRTRKIYEQQKIHDKKNGFCDKDNSNVANSSTWLFSLAQAYAQGRFFSRVEPLIERVYERDVSRTDAYARCAWQCYWSSREYAVLIPWMERDRAENRLSAEWILNLAKAYAANDEPDKAWPLVGDAYAQDKSIRDGYARCAWQCYWSSLEFAKLIQWMEMDRAENRLSPKWMLKLAMAYTSNHECDKAWPLVEDAYAQDKSIRNGYASCAWQCYWSSREYAALIPWMERDRAENRLSPRWMLKLAMAYASNHESDKAWPLIEEAYTQDKSIRDGYASCAWTFFHHERHLREPSWMLYWMNKDFELDRMSPVYLLRLARIYAAIDQVEKAWPLIEKAYRLDASLKDGYLNVAYEYSMSKWPRNEFKESVSWVLKDLQLSRVSKWGKTRRASEIFAALGDFDKAAEMLC